MKIKNQNFTLYRFKSKYDYLPLLVIFIYINFTYLLHLFFSESPSAKGLLFMFIIDISIILGYILPNTSEKGLSERKAGLNLIWNNRININKIIFLCSIIVILSSINMILTFYPNFSEIWYYLKNPGQAYINTKMIRVNPDLFDNVNAFSSIINILLTLLSATKYIFFMFMLLYWKQLSKIVQIISIITIIFYLISSFLSGAMITIGNILFSIIPLLLTFTKSRVQSVELGRKKSFRKNNKIKAIAFGSLGFFIILFFMTNRISEDGNLSDGIENLIFYVSHGYEGLDLCLDLFFEPTFGFTSFKGISDMLVKYLNAPDFFENSYLIRNEAINNYPALQIWSTIFPWLASDFSFFTLPFIMGYISYQFSIIWNISIRTGNPYGYLLVGQLFIFWLMVPANNQLFHTLGNSAAFIFILYLYIKSKRSYIVNVR